MQLLAWLAIGWGAIAVICLAILFALSKWSVADEPTRARDS